MKAAFVCWQKRIAPVFDVARQVRVADDDGGEDVLAELPAGAAERVGQLAGMGVRLVVCGAISRPVQGLLERAGLRVAAFVAGDVEEIIAAWRAGRFDQAAYAMPGCCGRRGRRHGRGAGTCRRGGVRSRARVMSPAREGSCCNI